MFVSRASLTLAATLWAACASASTVKDIALQLDFQGNSYFDFRIVDTSSGDILYNIDELTDQAYILLLGLPSLIDLPLGSTAGLSATLLIGEAGAPDQLVSCRFIDIDCTAAEQVTLGEDSFDFRYAGDTQRLAGGTDLGSKVVFDYLPSSLTVLSLSDTLRAEWTLWRSNFVVSENTPPQPAPVPLPASAPLVLAGMACLALVRRRGASS